METVPMSVFLRERKRPENWVTNNTGEPTYVGPGVFIPPRKEDCSCDCSTTDELGRPAFIGLCGDTCERRPR